MKTLSELFATAYGMPQVCMRAVKRALRRLGCVLDKLGDPVARWTMLPMILLFDAVFSRWYRLVAIDAERDFMVRVLRCGEDPEFPGAGFRADRADYIASLIERAFKARYGEGLLDRVRRGEIDDSLVLEVEALRGGVDEGEAR